MALSLGKIRYGLLLRFGNLFRRLDTLDNLRPARLLYNVLRWLWEVVSPSKVYHIVSFSEYASNHSVTKILLKSNRVGYAANAVCIGKGNRQELKELPLPIIYLYSLSEVLIHHSSDFIVKENERLVINDYCATKDDENKGYEDKWNYWQGGRVCILRKHSVSRSLDSGIMLNGKFSYNYYHNMYENLIRLSVLRECNHQIPNEVPIIVDEEIMNVPSFKRIYDILSKDLNRQTIIIRKNEQVNVKNLFYLTSVNSLVPVHWDYTKGKMEDYVFDRDYILKMRNTLLACMDNSVELPKRIFITRKSTTHRHFNEDELFSVLKPLGFKKVAPEEYSFEQQMALFNKAEWIVGGSGAALTNLLFTSPSCVIVCLYRNSNYIPAVFTAPVCFNEAKMYYFQSSKGESIMKAHTSFTIDVQDFQLFVNDWIAPAIVN